MVSVFNFPVIYHFDFCFLPLILSVKSLFVQPNLSGFLFLITKWYLSKMSVCWLLASTPVHDFHIGIHSTWLLVFYLNTGK